MGYNSDASLQFRPLRGKKPPAAGVGVANVRLGVGGTVPSNALDGGAIRFKDDTGVSASFCPNGSTIFFA